MQIIVGLGRVFSIFRHVPTGYGHLRFPVLYSGHMAQVIYRMNRLWIVEPANDTLESPVFDGDRRHRFGLAARLVRLERQ